jgi:hypothetical protein
MIILLPLMMSKRRGSRPSGGVPVTCGRSDFRPSLASVVATTRRRMVPASATAAGVLSQPRTR